MKDRPDWPEDFGVLARRAGVSPEHRNAFERALEGSASLQVAYRVGCAFDEIAGVREGDEQRIRRCVDQVIRGQRATRRLSLGAPRVWWSAALVLVASTAFGVWGVSRVGRGEDAPTSSAAPGLALQTGADRPCRGAACRQVTPPEPSPDEKKTAGPVEGSDTSRLGRVDPTTSRRTAATSEARRKQTAQTAAPARSATPHRAPDPGGSAAAFPTADSELAPPNAGQLFSMANAARRAGRQAEAMRLFSDLQRSHPGSPEARLSHVSLGRLMLTRGQASEALSQFESYLRGGGPLEEEALLGKAHALSALGQTTRERATYESLLHRFPQSVYAGEARGRLGSLETTR